MSVGLVSGEDSATAIGDAGARVVTGIEHGGERHDHVLGSLVVGPT